MRSPTRTATWAVAPPFVLVLVLALAACSTATGRIAPPVEDRSADAAERLRAAFFTVEDRSLDAVESRRDRAFSQ